MTIINSVVSYAARALKCLILDDALRPQVIVAGVPAIVCTCTKQWSKEVLCMRELLGALQTLTWDKSCLKSVLQVDIISTLFEISVVSITPVIIIYSFSNSMLTY